MTTERPPVEQGVTVRPHHQGATQDTTGLAAIKKLVEQTDRDAGRFTVKEAELQGMTAEGSDVLALFDVSDLVKILVTHYGEGSQKIESYYFVRNNPIAIRQAVRSYKSPIYIERIPVIADSSEVSYFKVSDHEYVSSPPMPTDTLKTIVEGLLENLILYKRTLAIP